MGDLVMNNLQGWLNKPNTAQLEQSRLKALALGAEQ
jgi:hypothetical protein